MQTLLSPTWSHELRKQKPQQGIHQNWHSKVLNIKIISYIQTHTKPLWPGNATVQQKTGSKAIKMSGQPFNYSYLKARLTNERF